MEKPTEKDHNDAKESKDSEDNTPEIILEKKPEVHCNPVYGDLLAVSAGIAAWIASELNILELESAINLLGLIDQNLIAILKQRYIDKKSRQIIE